MQSSASPSNGAQVLSCSVSTSAGGASAGRAKPFRSQSSWIDFLVGMHVFKSIGKTNHLSVDDKSSPLWVHLAMVILAEYPFQREDLHSAEWKSRSAAIEEKSEWKKVC